MGQVMDKIRFQIARFVDWCFKIQSDIQNCCRNTANKLGSSKHRPLYFAYSNVASCTLILIFMAINHSGGVLHYTKRFPKLLFLSVLVTEWTIAVILIVAYKKRSPILCILWCTLEICAILVLLFLNLSQIIAIGYAGLTLLAMVSMLKIYGLWHVYYFYLQIKNCPDDMRISKECERGDGMDIKYFDNRPRSHNSKDKANQKHRRQVTRSETIRTSVSSSAETENSEPNRTRNTSTSDTNDMDFVLCPFDGNRSLRSSLEEHENLKYAEVEVISESKSETMRQFSSNTSARNEQVSLITTGTASMNVTTN